MPELNKASYKKGIKIVPDSQCRYSQILTKKNSSIDSLYCFCVAHKHSPTPRKPFLRRICFRSPFLIPICSNISVLFPLFFFFKPPRYSVAPMTICHSRWSLPFRWARRILFSKRIQPRAIILIYLRIIPLGRWSWGKSSGAGSFERQFKKHDQSLLILLVNTGLKHTKTVVLSSSNGCFSRLTALMSAEYHAVLDLFHQATWVCFAVDWRGIPFPRPADKLPQSCTQNRRWSSSTTNNSAPRGSSYLKIENTTLRHAWRNPDEDAIGTSLV